MGLSRVKAGPKVSKAAILYNDPRWGELRLSILDRDLWTCQMCGVLLTEGKTRPTDAVVDHKTPHRGDAALFWDSGNLWSVCKWDHDTTCAAIEARTSQERVRAAKDAHRPVGLDGYPIRLNGPLAARSVAGGGCQNPRR